MQEVNGYPDISSIKLVNLDKALQQAEALRDEAEEEAGSIGALAAAMRDSGSSGGAGADGGAAAANDDDANQVVNAATLWARAAPLAESARLVYALRSALAQGGSGNVAEAERLVSGADVGALAEAATSEVATAQATVGHEAAALRALAALEEARSMADLTALEDALAAAGRLRLGEHPNARVVEALRSARGQVRALEEVQRGLRDGVANGDMGAIAAATAAAEAHGVQGEDLRAAQQKARELRALGERAREAYAALDCDTLKTLLVEARAANHTLEIERDAKGLLMMPEANVLLLKLERYHEGALPPQVNVAECSQRLLQLQYDENPDAFAFGAYEGLSDIARRAADLGRLCRPALGTLEAPKLAFAITRGVPAARAQQIFGCVMAYVGKSVDYIAQTDELLRTCAGGSGAERDEVLCQLVVLLTGAEDLTEMTRCWQLFSLCLQAFAPSEALLNRVDNFMRAEEEDTCLAELHRVLFAAHPRLPTVQDIQLMEGKKYYSSKCIAHMYTVK